MNKLQNWTCASLNNISQVILIRNPISGFLILAGIFISSPQLGTIALISSIFATAAAFYGSGDRDHIKQGLFGYNSVLTGMALYLFLSGPNAWWIALAGAVLAVAATAAFTQLFQNSTMPVLTFPFIILTWFMLLAGYRLQAFQLSSDLVPQFLSHQKLETLPVTNWPEALINGYGQIFFIDHNLSCLFILLAVFWASWKSGLLVIAANLLAILAAYLLGGDHVLITRGLYGYNAILVMLAVSAAFPAASRRQTIITGSISAIVSVLVTASVSSWMLPYGLPALTLPFVLTTWLILAARKVLPGL